jgi:hypothetical protein
LCHQAFLALGAMRHEISDLAKAFFSVMPIALAEKQAVKIIYTPLPCQ